MQILRFEDAPEVAPKRKKSSAGWIGLGLVAALFGVSTAFASSTIAINGTNAVDLGQGVVTVSGCDSEIGFKPITTLNLTSTAFVVTDVVIGHEFESGKGLIDTTACDGKQLKVSFYADVKDDTGTVTGRTQLDCGDLFRAGASFTGSDFESGGYGSVGWPVGSPRTNPTAFKCEAGSIYLGITLSGNNSINIHWNPAGAGPDYQFLASAFDHVTVESVSGETGLSAYTPSS